MKVMSSQDVARVCQVSTTTAQRWIDKGILPGFRVPGGKHRRVLEPTLREFMKEHNIPLEWLETFLRTPSASDS